MFALRFLAIVFHWDTAKSIFDLENSRPGHNENRPKSNQVIYRSGLSIQPKIKEIWKVVQCYRVNKILLPRYWLTALSYPYAQFSPTCWPRAAFVHRVGQSREIYSNSVPLSPPHWPYPKRIRPPSWPRVAVASSIQNTKLFTWRTWPGAGAVPKCDWAARSQCGFKQRRAYHTKYI